MFETCCAERQGFQQIFHCSYNYQPQRSRSAYDSGNMYGYSSMADSDWGWKKRKRSTLEGAMDKRHIAHWAARGNGLGC